MTIVCQRYSRRRDSIAIRCHYRWFMCDFELVSIFLFIMICSHFTEFSKPSSTINIPNDLPRNMLPMIYLASIWNNFLVEFDSLRLFWLCLFEMVTLIHQFAFEYQKYSVLIFDIGNFEDFFDSNYAGI